MKASFEEATKADFDLCVVGSGPAGIMCALEFARLNPKSRILLVEYGLGEKGESGGNNLDDAIRIETPVNHHPPEECTNKGLGGSSITWGGRCVMYERADFVPRAPFAHQCTWPESLFDEVNALSDEASRYFECVDGPFDLRQQPDIAYRPIAEGFVSGDVTDYKIEKWSLPTRFGTKFRDQLYANECVHVVFGCEIRKIDAVRADGTIEALTARCRFTRGEGRIRARAFVLACGAQEATRLLLKSAAVFGSRAGRPAALGRYYQGHISGKIASVQFHGDPRLTDHGFQRTKAGEYVRRRFQFPDEVLISKGIMNTAIWLDNPLYFDPSHRNGPMSFMYLAMITPILGRKLAPPAVAYSITKGKHYRLGAHLLNLLRDFPASFWVPASIFFRRYCMRRKLPGVFLPSGQNRFALHFHAEQEPVAENRMELAEDGETLRMYYHYTDYDADSVVRAHRLLDEWLRKTGCGELVYWYPEHELKDKIRALSRDGVHQVGTTRMSTKAEDGVVDLDLRVWGTRNLYVCSSSVFPTSGQANPTFLLGCFALRLARKLKDHALS